jgi:predicted site-specific integrase-resolvase
MTPIWLQRSRVNVSHAARLAGVTRQTVYAWMRAGRVEWVMLPSGVRRVFVDSIFHDEESHGRSRRRS